MTRRPTLYLALGLGGHGEMLAVDTNPDVPNSDINGGWCTVCLACAPSILEGDAVRRSETSSGTLAERLAHCFYLKRSMGGSYSAEVRILQSVVRTFGDIAIEEVALDVWSFCQPPTRR